MADRERERERERGVPNIRPAPAAGPPCDDIQKEFVFLSSPSSQLAAMGVICFPLPASQCRAKPTQRGSVIGADKSRSLLLHE